MTMSSDPGLYGYTSPDGRQVPLYLRPEEAAAAGLAPYTPGPAPDMAAMGGYSPMPVPPPPVSMEPPAGPPPQPTLQGAGGMGGASPVTMGAEGQGNTPYQQIGGGAPNQGQPPPPQDEPGNELRDVDLDLVLQRGGQGPRSSGSSPVRQVRPERMAEVGYSHAFAPGPDPAAVAEWKGSVLKRLGGIAGAGAQQSEMMGQGVNEQESFYHKQMDDLAVEQAKRAQLDTKLRTMQSEVDTRRKEAERLQDPTSENFWKEKGVIGHIMGAVTMMLGGYLQGKGVTADNEGTKLVDRAINQWIADARTKYEKKDKQYKESNNAYAEALARYGTPEAAEADMRMRGYAATVGLMQARGRRVPIAEFQNAVQDAVNDGLVKVNEWQINLSQLQTGQITEEHRLLPAQFSGGGVPKQDKFSVRLPNGEQGFTKPDEVENRDVQKRIDFHNFAAHQYKRLSHLLSQGGGYTSAQQAQIETIAYDITKAEEQALGQGVLREGERDEELKARGASFFSLNKPERLMERARMNGERRDSVVRNHVFTSPRRDEYYLGSEPTLNPTQ